MNWRKWSCLLMTLGCFWVWGSRTPLWAGEMDAMHLLNLLQKKGVITQEEATLARERSVFLEISARKGHCLANGHVARTALEVGASLILNTDTHAPGDLISRQQAERLARGAGLTEAAVHKLFDDAQDLAQRLAAQ